MKVRSLIFLGDFHSRIVSVTDVHASHFRSGGCQSLSVLVKHDVSLSLDELKVSGLVSKEGKYPSRS